LPDPGPEALPGRQAAPLPRGLASWRARFKNIDPLARAGLLVWAVFNLVVFILVWRDPGANSVVKTYRVGALGWWAGQDIFGQGVDGFLYLPSFAILFSPFALLGPLWGDLLWRLTSVGLLSYALWRAARLYLPQASLGVLGPTLLLLLPAGTAALRNGQATTLMLALMLLGALALAERRWWPSACWLALAFAVKPLAIVLLLLAGALYRPMALPLIVGVVLVLILPFANPDPAAVLHLYGLCLEKLAIAGTPGAGAWSEMTGILNRIGLAAPPLALMALRLASALAFLALGYLARRRQGERIAALDLFALSVCYLMLMNPRTEENTYIMLSTTIALFAILASRRDGRDGRGGRAVLLTILCLALGNHNYGEWFFRSTVLWLKPLVCLAFLPFLIQSCLAPDRLKPTRLKT
jgi:alpha-1,2-mannosyltransferase